MDFDETTLISSENTFASPRHQNFSIPSSVIYYITRTPTLPNEYRKLQKSCKYFYSKNPIIVVERLSNWKVNKNDKKYLINIWHHPSSQYFFINNFENISYKIWIVNENCNYQTENISKVFQKIYRFDAKILTIQKQNISFDELLLFSSSPNLYKIWLHNANIQHSNNSFVSIHEIFAIFPKLIDFYFYSREDNPGVITVDTVKMLLQIQNFQKIKYLFLYKVPEFFDFVMFSEFMKKKKQTDFTLIFGNALSETYKNRIHNFISWALDLAHLDKSYLPPLMSCSLDNSDIINKICKLRSDFISKHKY